MNKTLLRMLVALFLVAGIGTMLAYRDHVDAMALELWIAGLGIAGPIVFMLIYAVGTVFFFPGSVLTLAGGAIFGPVWGTLYNLTGATIGAAFAFLVARYLASDWVEMKSAGRLGQIKKGVEGEGWRFVAFVRLVPLFPFNVLNYALGLTRIRLSTYVITSYITMLPGAIAYTYLGYVGREAIAGSEGMIQKSLLALALLAVVSFLPGLIGRLRRAPMMHVVELDEHLGRANAPLIVDVRSADEFSGELGHIKGAINIPLPDFKQRLGELNSYVEKDIALVCRTDVRSAKASLILAKHGFHKVHVVRGGMVAWNESGFSIER